MRIRIKKFGDYHRPQYKKWFQWWNYTRHLDSGPHSIEGIIQFSNFEEARAFALEEAKKQYQICELHGRFYIQSHGSCGSYSYPTLSQAQIDARKMAESHTEHEPIYHPYE